MANEIYNKKKAGDSLSFLYYFISHFFQSDPIMSKKNCLCQINGPFYPFFFVFKPSRCVEHVNKKKKMNIREIINSDKKLLFENKRRIKNILCRDNKVFMKMGFKIVPFPKKPRIKIKMNRFFGFKLLLFFFQKSLKIYTRCDMTRCYFE